MSGKLAKIEDSGWYQLLIADCHGIIEGGIRDSRWVLIEAYWNLGNRILEESTNFNDRAVYGAAIPQRVAESLQKSRRSVEYAMQFARQYDSLDQLRETKNLTWRKVCLELLPKSPESETPELPVGRYAVIYADPPWPYPQRQDAKNLYGNVDYHYETMKIPDICALPIGDLAGENSVLFMWVATNFLEQSFKVINSWGFSYKSNVVWVKKKKPAVFGWYVNAEHELLLIATRGSYIPKDRRLPSSVLYAPVQKHSRKPEEAYGLIERLYPGGRYLELFLRGEPHNHNWVGWGNEADDGC